MNMSLQNSRYFVALSRLSLGVSLALLATACDNEVADPSAAKHENQPNTAVAEKGKNAAQQPAVGGQAPHQPAASAPTGPDYIKTHYEPKVQLGGLYTFDQLDIPSHDGITIEALVTEPTAKGKHPLILMPGSWTMNRKEYEIPARQWASRGFVVISYTSRGFHGSGGEIDIAGPDTIKDVSSLIDWAIQNTSADEERIGALGISYGGGASLLAAAEDPRIDAVASMSGWTDLAFSNYPNQTGSASAGGFLVSTAEKTGRRGQVMKDIDKYLEQGKVEEALAIMDERSPINVVDKINKNGTAVMIAQAWNDGIFPPRQSISFFEKLEGDKRLLLQPGGHGSPDGAGVAGLPDRTWSQALEWMKKHVVGEDIVQGAPVMVVSNDNQFVTTAASIEDWKADPHDFYLGPPQAEGIIHHYGAMTTQGMFGWYGEFEGGKDTVAQSGVLLVSGAINGLIGLPQIMHTETVSREHAMIWKSDPLLTSQNISGSPKIQFNLQSTDSSATLVAYLYESVAGVASLITYAPFSVRDLEPGASKEVEFELEPTEWNMVPGSRLVLVVDTMDDRYQSETRKGQNIEIASTGTHQAKISVPMRPAF